MGSPGHISGFFRRDGASRNASLAAWIGEVDARSVAAIGRRPAADANRNSSRYGSSIIIQMLERASQMKERWREILVVLLLIHIVPCSFCVAALVLGLPSSERLQKLGAWAAAGDGTASAPSPLASHGAASGGRREVGASSDGTSWGGVAAVSASWAGTGAAMTGGGASAGGGCDAAAGGTPAGGGHEEDRGDGIDQSHRSATRGGGGQRERAAAALPASTEVSAMHEAYY